MHDQSAFSTFALMQNNWFTSHNRLDPQLIDLSKAHTTPLHDALQQVATIKEAVFSTIKGRTALVDISSLTSSDYYIYYQSPSFRLLDNRIAHLSYNDVITSGYTDVVCQIIVDTANNKENEGLLFSLDTIGGSVDASYRLQEAIAYYQQRKPMVVHSHKLHSGGILSTLPCLEVMAADARSTFGSIGACWYLDKAYFEYLKNETIILYDKGATNKNLAERKAVSDADYSLYQQEVDRDGEEFRNQVRKYRNLHGNDERIATTLAGDVFDAQDAKRRGLIHSIGTVDDAFEKIMLLKKL